MKAAVLLFVLIAPPALALPDCSPLTEAGSRCAVAIEKLRPTQPFVGQLQVDANQAKLADKSSKQLNHYLEKKTIPVVISPDGRFWLVDRHHLTKALWQLGVKQVPVSVIARLQDKNTFWQQMSANHWAWLKDQQGQPVAPQQLPQQIGELPDYPYRSLAGELQDAGYFEKNQQVYFVEFAWANWLAEKMGHATVNAGNLAERLEQAKKLACSPQAKPLPGYPGKMCRAQ